MAFFFLFLIKETEIWVKRGSKILAGRAKFFEWEALKFLGAPIVGEIETYCGSFKTTLIVCYCGKVFSSSILIIHVITY